MGIRESKLVNENKAYKLHTVKSHLIVQFNKFSGHGSVAISCDSSVTLVPLKSDTNSCVIQRRKLCQFIVNWK